MVPIGLVMQTAASALPPPLLQIVRGPLKPGVEAAFNAIEEQRARMSAAPNESRLMASAGRKGFDTYCKWS